jgi:hypothetical protein
LHEFLFAESPLAKHLVGVLSDVGRGALDSGLGATESWRWRGLDRTVALDEIAASHLVRMRWRHGQGEHGRDARFTAVEEQNGAGPTPPTSSTLSEVSGP